MIFNAVSLPQSDSSIKNLYVSLFFGLSLLWGSSACSMAEEGASAEKQEEGSPKFTNRLSKETSPYLLMHAHNPVDWYPWGEEAFAKAKKENKVIFLSVGYSSCHWCHVMEEESFKDEEIAAFLNKHFVCIKVDREERPDVDSIYMLAVQIITQQGGWPMSVFLTPEAQPFFGGTYWPARDGDRQGAIGFATVTSRIHKLWTEDEEKVRSSSAQLTGMIKQAMGSRLTLKPLELNEALLSTIDEVFASDFDPEHGGFRFDVNNPRVPKFPEPSNLSYLLARAKSGNVKAKNMFLKTLDEMADGGIRDHLGGGFHRYSVDRFWSIPHFEKMLYDNGQLASIYAEAFELTGEKKYRQITEELLAFVLREMTGPNGQFYSALDADSEGEEGKFYRFEKEELEEILSEEELSLAKIVYGLGGTPNFEGEYYAPELQGDPEQLAVNLKIKPTKFKQQLETIKKKLFDHRGNRVRPLLDTKVVTAWNGLMISGFADSGRRLNDPKHVKAAAKAAEFCLSNLRTKEGRLMRTYGEDGAKLNGYLDDYAFLSAGLLALHKATGEERWLDEAENLTNTQIEFFADEKNGGFFFTSSDHEALIARGKSPTDGALPSGITVSADNLYYLWKHTKDKKYKSYLDSLIQSNAALLDVSPQSMPRLGVVIQQLLAEEE